MTRSITISKKHLIVALAALLLIAGAAWAYAQSVEPDYVYACVSAKGDDLRLVLGATDCKAKETVVRIPTGALTDVLQANIDAEAVARIAADADLQTGLDAETATRAQEDGTLQANVDAEVAARTAADTDLQAGLDAETATRAQEDGTLQANVDAEVAARTAADTDLQAGLDAETATRAQEDGILQANIDTEEQARIAADAALQAALESGCTGTLWGTRWCENGDGTVTDLTSGLVWLQNANCYGQQTWADAMSIPAALDSGECNLADGSSEGDWRLPSVDELKSLREGDEGILASTPGPFLNVQSSYYWSSTMSDWPDYAWIVYLGGASWTRGPVDSAYDLWPVRDLGAHNHDADYASLAALESLQANIDAEAATRAEEDGVLQASIASEVTARTDADAALQTNLDNHDHDTDYASLAALELLQAQVDELEARIAALEPCSGTLHGTGTRWCVNGDGTVTDLTTGLVWLRNANCYGRQTWAAAMSIPTALDSGECGLTDGSQEGNWRLPSLDDLKSLVEGDESILASTPGPFLNVQSFRYWSSTTTPFDPNDAWNVSMGYGGVNDDNKTNTREMWPVRGGP